MDVPDTLIECMSAVQKNKYKDEGITLCVETIDQIRAFDDISGIHIMGIEWGQVIHEIDTRA